MLNTPNGRQISERVLFRLRSLCGGFLIWLPTSLILVQVALITAEVLGYSPLGKGVFVLLSVLATTVAIAVVLMLVAIGGLLGASFRFSLRWLLFLILAASISFGWMASAVHNAKQQRMAVANLQRVGFAMGYDVQCTDEPPHFYDSRSWPYTDLYDMLGIDFFQDVYFAGLAKSGFFFESSETENESSETVVESSDTAIEVAGMTNSDLKALRRLPRLRDLLIDCSVTPDGTPSFQGEPGLSSPVTDEGLEVLNGLFELRFLCLSDNRRITDRTLAHLSQLRNLEQLHIHQTEITGSGFKHIQVLDRLKTLNVAGNPINDAGLEQISKLQLLKRLNVSNTKITSAGLRNLRSLRQLRELDLSSNKIRGIGPKDLAPLHHLRSLSLQATQIGDSSLENLRELNNLEYLDLTGTQISDTGLKHLKDLRRLRCLILSQTQITDAGLEALTGLTKLESLVLSETNVTDAARERLKQLPQFGSLDLENPLFEVVVEDN